MKLFYEKLDGDERLTPIFMIHTTPLDSRYLFNSNINLKNTVYLIDLPSHGQSEEVDYEDINFSNFVKNIEDLREYLEIDKVIIYGHGIGGFIAMLYAISHTKKIERMIVSNTAVSASYRNQMAWNIRSQYSHMVKDALERVARKTDDKSIRMRFTQSLSTHFHPKDQEKANQLLDTAHKIASEPYVMISHYEIPKYNIREQIRKVDKPTLILGGAYDVWPIDEVKKINIDIPHAKLHFFKSGHFPMVDLPEKYWKVISNWLESEN